MTGCDTFDYKESRKSFESVLKTGRATTRSFMDRLSVDLEIRNKVKNEI